MTYSDHPKISFAYPTFIRPGMLAAGPFIPDIGWKVEEFPTKLTFYISAGLILNSRRGYSFDIDLIFEGKSLIPDNKPPQDSQLIGTAVSIRDDFVGLATALLDDVDIPSDGLYTIRVSLYAGTTDTGNRELIDQHESHFVLASDWLPNEMKPQEQVNAPGS